MTEGRTVRSASAARPAGWLAAALAAGLAALVSLPGKPAAQGAPGIEAPAAVPKRKAIRKRRAVRPPAAVPGTPGDTGADDVYAAVPAIDDRGRDQHAMFRAWNPDPIGNHERNLAAVRPDLAAVVRWALADNPGLRFVVGSGARTPAEQQQAEMWGWSPRRSARRKNASLRKHIDGMAVDLWPLDGAGRVTFAPALQLQVAAAMRRAARDLGVPVSWGGAWRGRKDLTHFELVR